MDIRRTPQQTVLVCVTALVSGGLAWWNIHDWQRTGNLTLLVLGGVFAVWTVYLFANLACRGVPARIDGDGITIRRVTRSVRIPFDQMTWVRLGGGRRAGLIAYRPPGAQKEQCVAFAQKTVGPEGVEAIRSAIAAARPDLPDHRPDPGTEEKQG